MTNEESEFGGNSVDPPPHEITASEQLRALYATNPDDPATGFELEER